jgi:hypothetical protein
LSTISLFFTGCLDIEEGITLDENGGGKMEIKTDMSEVMAMMSMAGIGKGETLIKDTVISYKNKVDTAQMLAAEEKELLRNAGCRIKMNSTEGIWIVTLAALFKKPGDINKITAAFQKWDNMNLMKEAFKDMIPEGGADMEGMGFDNKAVNKNIGDMTKDYFKTSWQNGKLLKVLDTAAYKKIEDDETLNSFKKLGELVPGGEKILENINVIAKFVLPRPATKAEGKNLKISADKKTITVSNLVADIYDKPQNFEYTIEYCP